MTYATLDALGNVFVGFGVVIIIWLMLTIAEIFMPETKVCNGVRTFYKWYSRIFMTVMIIIFLFIMTWLIETRSYWR